MMKAILTFLTLTLILLGCNSEKEPEDIHFGPGPGDTEETS
jgi:uncharacterized lipoprotein NlpE involved in copper resistance